MRLFVAAALPESWKDALDRAAGPWRTRAYAGILPGGKIIISPWSFWERPTVWTT